GGRGAGRPADDARQQLRAKAKAEIGNAHRDHLGDPVQLAFDSVERAAIVGRHRPAEDHHAGIVRHVLGQLAAEVGAQVMELVTAPLEEGADPAGSRMLLVHDDRDLRGVTLFGLLSRYRHGFARYARVMATTRRTPGGETKWRASSTSTSTVPAPGPTLPSTPCSRWRPNWAPTSPGSPSWSVACSTPSTRPSTTTAPGPIR